MTNLFDWRHNIFASPRTSIHVLQLRKRLENDANFMGAVDSLRAPNGGVGVMFLNNKQKTSLNIASVKWSS